MPGDHRPDQVEERSDTCFLHSSIEFLQIDLGSRPRSKETGFPAIVLSKRCQAATLYFSDRIGLGRSVPLPLLIILKTAGVVHIRLLLWQPERFTFLRFSSPVVPVFWIAFPEPHENFRLIESALPSQSEKEFFKRLFYSQRKGGYSGFQLFNCAPTSRPIM